jgi:predicted AAA+ superfamily ATPase
MEKIIKNPYAPKNNNHDYASYLNLFHTYFEMRGEYPMVYEIGSTNPEPDLLEKSGFSLVFSQDSENPKGEIVNMESYYQSAAGTMVHFCRKESMMDRIDRIERKYSGDDTEDQDQQPTYSCKVLYRHKSELENALVSIKRAPENKKSGKIYLLCSMDGMLELQKFKTRLPSTDIDLEMNYGSEAAAKFDKISSLMDSDKNGLVLLSGHPGTGKSTFIKMLSTKTRRKLIYLSSSSAEQLTNPEFLSFMMRQRDSVLLLEDAEKVLRSREEQDNSAISNLLNITDGILGDCLNILVIATFNMEREKIDSALVRKGRLLVEHQFELLSPEMANKLLESIGSDRRVSEPISLAEIYNPDDNFHEEEEEKRKVGF